MRREANQKVSIMKKLWHWLRGKSGDPLRETSNESLACLLFLRQLALYAKTGVTNTTASRQAERLLRRITPDERM
jgi:hypothetical protein